MIIQRRNRLLFLRWLRSPLLVVGDPAAHEVYRFS